MRAEPLFLRRCEQVANFLQSQSEVDLLDIARILRQIMMDNHSLMDTANINRMTPNERWRFRFRPNSRHNSFNQFRRDFYFLGRASTVTDGCFNFSFGEVLSAIALGCH